MSSMHLNLRALRHVVTLAKTLNFTEAARQLHLSQSALTRSIQSTEQRSELRLFDRDRGGVHLTASGRTFVERAERLLLEAEDFGRQISRMAGGEDQQVAFGMAPLPARTLLSKLATETLSLPNRLRWQVEINTAEELLRLLLAEQIEFFVCAGEQLTDSPAIKAQTLGRFPLSFVVRKNHPLLCGHSDHDNYPVVSVAPIPSYERFPPSLLAAMEHPPRLIINDYALLAEQTRQTDAIWPTSSFAVLEELRSGELAMLNTENEQPGIHIDIVMYSLHKRTLSPAALQLQKRFRKDIKTL